MRNLAPEITNLLLQRNGLDVRRLYWIKARNRTTGEIEAIGIWSGLDHRDFVINGETRTYYGTGNLLNIGTLKTETGLTIRKLTISASPLTAEAQKVMFEYDPKFAPIELHLAFFDPETDNLVAAPYRAFKGWIDTMNHTTPAIGGDAESTINNVGHTRILTRVFPAKRSNETQKLRNSIDSFFAAVAITGTIQTPWGQN